MPRPSFQLPISESPTTPPVYPVLKNRIDEAEADAREGLFRWLIFLLAGGVGLAYFLD
jgi:hypothetical protein